VYASASLSLAAVELFVHLEPGLAPDDLVFLSATLPAAEPALTIAPAELPGDWRADQVASRSIGDNWIRAGSSLALRVPSIPLPVEWNVLINPLHPRMNELEIDPPQAFVFDARMFR
jgi:RES domain-containing protein